MWSRAVLCLLLPLAQAQYCDGGNTVEGDSNLGNVNMQGVQGTSISDTSNCPGGVGVIDMLNKKVSLQPGGTYSLTFQATTCGSGWARLAYAFIDYNQNGKYDVDELLGQQTIDNRLTPVDVNFQVIPPCEGAALKTGTTRMRVLVVESGATPNPCLVFSYGGVKEFTVDMIASPGAQCGGADMSLGGGLSGGSQFLITIFVLLVVYFIGSAVWVLKVRPEHRDKVFFAPLTKAFWVKFMGYVKDGCLLSKNFSMQLIDRARGKKVHSGYDAI